MRNVPPLTSTGRNPSEEYMAKSDGKMFPVAGMTGNDGFPCSTTSEPCISGRDMSSVMTSVAVNNRNGSVKERGATKTMRNG